MWALGAGLALLSFCPDVLAFLKCQLVVCVGRAPHGRAASGCFLICTLSLVWLSRPSACVVCVVFCGSRVHFGEGFLHVPPL